MASILKHIRSTTADKRPTGSGLADGQIAINTASGTPGVFFKNSAGTVTKVGPTHVGAAAPNAAPAGSAGNSIGETWVDNSTTTHGLKYYTGSTFYNLTPSGTTTAVGLVELATDAETQAGSDSARAVTPSSLQSKVSDSISTSGSTTIASSLAVKNAYDLANAALPKTGGRVTGNLEIGPTGTLSFEGSSDDSFETTFAVVNPTTDNTITFPNISGTVVTGADTGTVTSAMILDGTIVNGDISAAAAIGLSKLAAGALPSGITVNSDNIVDLSIVNADINASAAIVDTKLATIATAGKVSNSATTATSGNTANAIVARDASGNFTAGTITATLIGNASTVTTNADLTGDITSIGNATTIASGVIVNADINASAAIDLSKLGSGALPTAITVASANIVNDSILNADVNTAAAIAGTKISPDFGSQTVQTTGIFSAAAGTAGAPSIAFTGDTDTGFYSPGVNQAAISTAGTGRLFIDSAGKVGIGTATPGGKLQINAQDGFLFDVGAGAYSYMRFGSQGTGEGVTELGSERTTGSVFIKTGYTGSTLNTRLELNAAGATIFYNQSGLERARIDSSGRLLVGTSTSVTTIIQAGLQVQGLGANCYTSLGRWDNNAANAGLIFNKSRGGAVGTRAIVQSGDNLGEITFTGDDGSAFIGAAAIQAAVDGTPGTNDMPCRLVFFTTSDGASSPTERMRITSAGVLQIADAGNITVGTATGTKIGTATTQKLGFYNATPVVQPTAVANATDAATVITQLNALLAKLRTLGIIAT